MSVWRAVRRGGCWLVCREDGVTVGRGRRPKAFRSGRSAFRVASRLNRAEQRRGAKALRAVFR